MPQDPTDPLAALVGYVARVLAQDAFQPGDFTDEAMIDFLLAGAQLLAVGNRRHLEARYQFDSHVGDVLASTPEGVDTAALKAGQSDANDLRNRLDLAARSEAYEGLVGAVENFRGGDVLALSTWATRWISYFGDQPAPSTGDLGSAP